MTKFFATLALAVSVFTVSAQQRTTAPAQQTTITVEEKVATTARKITSKLGLTAEQHSKLQPLLTDFYKTKERLAAIKTSNPTEYKAGMKTTADNLVNNIKGILNETQLATFNQMVSQLAAE